MPLDKGTIKNMDEITLLKAWSRLQACRQNVPSDPIEELYINEYHTILQAIEQLTTYDLRDFFVPGNALKHILTGRDAHGQIKYSTSRFCNREIFLMKLDAVITFFNTLIPEDRRKQIGF